MHDWIDFTWMAQAEQVLRGMHTANVRSTLSCLNTIVSLGGFNFSLTRPAAFQAFSRMTEPTWDFARLLATGSTTARLAFVRLLAYPG